MSTRQLDELISELQACFGAWTAATTLEEQRRDWDGLFGRQEPCSSVGAHCETVEVGGVPALRIAAGTAAPDRAVLYLHGGGYVLGSPHSHRDLGEFLSRAAEAQVFVLDYRLAPEHPFPAAVDDATAAYRGLLGSGFTADRIAIGGDSAGGGLTLATLLSIREHELPMPACAVTLSPWADLECSSSTYVSQIGIDPLVNKEGSVQMAAIYVPEGDRKHPLASPFYADLTGLPPLLMQVGEREMMLGDTLRVAENARAAGVAVRVEIEPGQIHVFQIYASRLDEAVAAIDRLGAFILQHTPPGTTS